MDEVDIKNKVLACQIHLLEQILLQNENFDVKCFCSLMSLCYKKTIGSDNIAQNFEIYIRPNSRIFKTIKDIIGFIDNENNERVEKQFQDIKNVLIILQETRFAIVTKNGNNASVFNVVEMNRQFLQQIVKDCLIKIEECIADDNAKKDNFNDMQLSIDDILKPNAVKLSPTTGILYLNNNPYQFFVEKILFLSRVEEFENIANAKLYGTIVHKILEGFAIECKQMYKDALPDATMMRKIFFNISDRLLLETNTNDENFIKEKINKLFDIAYKLELATSKHKRFVLTETEFYTKIQGVLISAKADRIEIDYQKKEVYIYDFKTGTLPSNGDEKYGIKAQLAIIGYLILKDKKYSDYKINLMRYVDVSGKGNYGRKTDIDITEINFVEAKLKKMIDIYFYNCLPIVENMRYIKDYQQRNFNNENNLAYFDREEFII